MRLEKAIKILRPLDQDEKITLDSDTYDAIQLGIEALKHCKEYRETAECGFSWLLPGETEE